MGPPQARREIHSSKFDRSLEAIGSRGVAVMLAVSRSLFSRRVGVEIPVPHCPEDREPCRKPVHRFKTLNGVYSLAFSTLGLSGYLNSPVEADEEP